MLISRLRSHHVNKHILEKNIVDKDEYPWKAEVQDIMYLDIAKMKEKICFGQDCWIKDIKS